MKRSFAVPAGCRGLRCRLALLALICLGELPAIAGQIGFSNYWTQVEGLPVRRRDMGCVIFNDTLYVIGGQTGWGPGTVYTNVYRFDGSFWTEVAGLPAAMSGPACGALDGVLYCAAGATNGSYGSTNVYRFDGTNWSQVAGLSEVRRSMGSAVMNGRLHAIGGDNNSNTQTNVFRFDGTNWDQAAGLPQARLYLSAANYNGQIYAIGGATVAGPSRTNVYRYDGTNWTETAGLPASRMKMGSAVLNDKLYSLGGSYYDGASGYYCTNVYRYDGTNWTEIIGLSTANAGLAAGTLHGVLYAIGGLSGQGVTDPYTNVFRYTGALSSGVTPASGSITGGTEVVISGAGLCHGTTGDVAWVTICGATATVQSVAGSTQIVVRADHGLTAGIGNVRVCSLVYGTCSAANAYTYIGACMDILGTNGAVVASGEVPTVAKGTDFRAWPVGVALTNAFAITNAGVDPLNVTGLTTNGAGAAWFTVSNLPGGVATNAAVSNFSVTFQAGAIGVHTAVVSIVNDSPTTPYRLNLCGTVGGEIGLSTTTLAFAGTYGGANPSAQAFIITNLNSIPFNFSNAWQYDANASGWLTVAPLIGSIAGEGGRSITGSVSIAGLNAGSYLATNTAIATNAWNGMQRLVVALTVGRAGQTISFSNPGNQIATNTVSLSATSSAGLAVSFSVTSGPAQITGGTLLSFTGAGSVSVVAAQAGNSNWTAAPNVTSTFTVAKAAQTIAFLVIPDQVVTSSVTLAATAGSGLAVSFAVAGGPGVISGGNTLSFSGAGAVKVAASQAGNAIWQAATNVTNSLTVAKLAQTIAFPAIPNQVATSTVSLVATSSSALAVSFAVAGGPGVISGGNTLSFSGAGAVKVAASQAGNALWQTATNVTNTVVVTAVPSLPAPQNVTASQGTYTDRVAIAWSPVAEAAGYQVRRNTVDDSSSATLLGTPAGAAYNDAGAIARQVYYYWIKATNALSTSAFSASASGWRASPAVEIPQILSADFDGDRKADPAVYQGSIGKWFVRLSASGYFTASLTGFGGSGYSAFVGDYDGDGCADLGIFQLATGNWQVKLSRSGYSTATAAGFGDSDSAIVACDFDGDGLIDPTIYNTATGTWRIMLSGSGYGIATVTGFGGAGYTQVAGAYDADRLADPAIYGTASGNWAVMLSSQGYYIAGLQNFGGAGGEPLMADFDGDGRADLAYYTAGAKTWYVKLSGAGYGLAVLSNYGGAGYLSGAADYDGDRKADPTLLDLATGVWHIRLSGGGYSEATLASGWTP